MTLDSNGRIACSPQMSAFRFASRTTTNLTRTTPRFFSQSKPAMGVTIENVSTPDMPKNLLVI